MESGFLALGSTATCAEATFLPATLNFTPPINNYNSSTTTPLEGYATVLASNGQIDSPFQGEVLVNGQPSKALVKQLSMSVTDACNNTYTNAEAAYGNTITQQCKYAQRYVPASLYSGKLRLLIQAIYGSLRQDYYAVPITQGNFICCDLVFDDYRLMQNIPSSGLFTTDNYAYYLVEVSLTQVVFRELKLSAASKSWAKILATHPNKSDRVFSSRVEAYILSTAKLDHNFTPIIRSTGLSDLGVPIAYGFHFNWKGSQAKCVVHRGYDSSTYMSKTITIDIAEDLSITASESSEKAWSNGMYFQFWYPDQYSYAMKTFGVVTGGYTNTTNCPMYGYFDYNDVWQEFTVSCSLSTSNVGNDTGPLTQSHLTGFGGDSINYSRIYTSSTTVVNGTVGYSIAGESFSGAISGTITTVDEHTNPVVATPTYSGSGITSTNSNGPNIREGMTLMQWLGQEWPPGVNKPGWKYNPSIPSALWRVETTNGVAPPNNSLIDQPISPGLGDAASVSFTYNRYSGLTNHAEIMMGITLGDCEAVVYGEYSGRSWTDRLTGTSSLTGVLFQTVYRVDRFRYITGTGWVNQGLTAYKDREQLLRLQNLSPSILSSTSVGPGASTTTTIKFKSSCESGWVRQTVDGPQIKTETVASLMPSWANKYFRVGDGFGGFYHPTMIARASANGAHIMYHDEGDGANENGYPNGVYNSVGWV